MITTKLITNEWCERVCGESNGYIVIPMSHFAYKFDYDYLNDMYNLPVEMNTDYFDEDGNKVIGFDTQHLHQTKENTPNSLVQAWCFEIVKQIEERGKPSPESVQKYNRDKYCLD